MIVTLCFAKALSPKGAGTPLSHSGNRVMANMAMNGNSFIVNHFCLLACEYQDVH